MLPLLTPKLPQVPDCRGARDDSLVRLFERIQQGEKERRSFRERRATPRVAVALDVETESGEVKVMQTTHDLSTFGLAVRGGHTPPAGARLRVKVFLPDEPQAPLDLEAEVLGAFDEHGGARMRFLKPAVEDVRRIHRFLK